MDGQTYFLLTAKQTNKQCFFLTAKQTNKQNLVRYHSIKYFYCCGLQICPFGDWATSLGKSLIISFSVKDCWKQQRKVPLVPFTVSHFQCLTSIWYWTTNSTMVVTYLLQFIWLHGKSTRSCFSACMHKRMERVQVQLKHAGLASS